MQDFLSNAASKLGIGTNEAASATGSILDVIKDHADPSDFSSLVDKVPGVGDLVSKASGGGSGMMGMLGGMVGGNAGKALGAADLVSKSGLSIDKLGSLLGMFKEYVEPLLGSDLLKKLLAKVPGLGDIAK